MSGNVKSCTTQLLTAYDVIGKHLEEGKQTNTIFFLFFKSIWFSGSQYVNHKLHKLGFSGKLLQFVD